MTKVIILSLFLLLLSLSHAQAQNNPTSSDNNSKGPSSVDSEKSKIKSLLSSKRDFPFTDPRILENKNVYEETIMEQILLDLENSTNFTETLSKYPQNSSISLPIKDKFAYHILIDTDAIHLYVYAFDLALEGCGANPKNLRLIHQSEIKGNIFELRSIPNKKYRVIIEQLLTDSSNIITETNQEIPLFITIHPSLTFLPAVIIEDTLENIRVDFKSLKTKFCRDCPNIISFDEYAYLTWYTKGLNKEIENLDVKSKTVNIGFHPKAIFIAYPLEHVTKSDEDDKIVKHHYCKDRIMYQDSFVQNAFFEKSPEKVSSDLLYFYIKQATEKANPTSKVEIQYPCYPKYYSEKLESLIIKGSGNIQECKSEIKSFLKRHEIRSETPQLFGIPNYKLPWPLERLKDSDLLKESTIYIDSALIASLFKAQELQNNYKVITLNDLTQEINSYCTTFLGQDVDPNMSTKDKKDQLGKCFYILYSLSLLEQAGLDGSRSIRLKSTETINEVWISGLTITNIETFYDLEYQWFLQTQQNVVDRYANLIKEKEQQEKRFALNVTFGIIIFLMVMFWVAFIIRYRKMEESEIKDTNKKK